MRVQVSFTLHPNLSNRRTDSQYKGFPTGHPSYEIISFTASSSGSRRNKLRSADRMWRMQGPAGRGEVAMTTVRRSFSAIAGGTPSAGHAGDTGCATEVDAAAPPVFNAPRAAWLPPPPPPPPPCVFDDGLARMRAYSFASTGTPVLAVWSMGHRETNVGKCGASSREMKVTVRGFGSSHAPAVRLMWSTTPCRLSQHLSPTSTAPPQFLPWAAQAEQQALGDAAMVELEKRSMPEMSAPGSTWKWAAHSAPNRCRAEAATREAAEARAAREAREVGETRHW